MLIWSLFTHFRIGLRQKRLLQNTPLVHIDLLLSIFLLDLSLNPWELKCQAIKYICNFLAMLTFDRMKQKIPIRFSSQTFIGTSFELRRSHSKFQIRGTDPKVILRIAKFMRRCLKKENPSSQQKINPDFLGV